MTDDQKMITQLLARLRGIISLSGNLSDDRLTDRTGPNDAAQRGIMYCEARRLAREAIEIEFLEQWRSRAASHLPIGEGVEKVTAIMFMPYLPDRVSISTSLSDSLYDKEDEVVMASSVAPHAERREIGDVYLGVSHEYFRVIGEATYEDFARQYDSPNFYPFYYWTEKVENHQ